METTLDKMNACAAIAERGDASKVSALVGALTDPDWRVRYAAIVALGDLGDSRAVEPLLDLLRAEAIEPLFSQPPLEAGGPGGGATPFAVRFPEGTTETTKESWRRRGRLLQAGCLALANLGPPAAASLELLNDFATDQKRDYMVRAAACKALGQLACPESLPVLEQATRDEEWCTACEARKAVVAIRQCVQSDTRIRIGIVGLNFGRHILEALRTGPAAGRFEIAAVCDLDEEKARLHARETGARACRDYAELLADPTIPAIGLFTPPVGRAGLIRQALRAGKHVMTTKPFEVDVDAAAAVLAEARAAARIVHLNSPAPTLSPDLAQIRAWQSDYDLGRPVGCRADVWADYREQADGSWYDDPRRCPVAPVFRLGIYLIHDVLLFFGAPQSVQVMHSRLRTDRPTPDNAQLALRFHGGGLATIFASFCIGDGDHYRNSLTLNFERGTVYRNSGPQRAAGGATELALVMARDGRRVVVAQVECEAASGEYQWHVFADALRTGTLPDPDVDRRIVEGLRIIRAMAQAERSGTTDEISTHNIKENR
jgi:predicted dehydrogenase